MKYLLILAVILCGCSESDDPPEYAGYVTIQASASSDTTTPNHIISLTANRSISGYVYIHDSGWYLEDGPSQPYLSTAYLDLTNAWFDTAGTYTIAYRIVWRDGYGNETTTIDRIVVDVQPLPSRG